VITSRLSACASFLALALVGCAQGSNEFILVQIVAEDAGKKDARAPYDAGVNPPVSDGGVDARPIVPETGPPQCNLSLTTGDPQCDNCIGAQCCATENACTGDADCRGLIACYNVCAQDPNTMQTCMSTCDTQYPRGYALLDALGACMGSSCSVECGGP
jgi:hypothetical protein